MKTARILIALTGLGLVLAACDLAGSNAASTQSQDIADLTKALVAQNVSGAATINDESSNASESSASNVSPGMAERGLGGGGAATMAITVTHSYPGFTGAKSLVTMASDVVTVVRTWTNARGESVRTTLVRPEIPIAGTPGSFSYTASAPAGTSLNLVWDGAHALWTLTGSETKELDGITLSATTVTMVYDNAGKLQSLERQGETIGSETGRVRLDTTIYYQNTGSNPVEYLRVMDYLGAGNAQLKREVYVWNLASLSGLPQSAGVGLSLIPAPPAGFDLIYQANPSVTLAPVYANPATYPTLDTGAWLRIVSQRKDPRIADWYRPTAGATGEFVRRYQETTLADGSGTQRTTYAADGVTVKETLGAVRFHSANDGSFTTTCSFSDGTSSVVTITPNASGYDVSRKLRGGASQTWSVSYTKDGEGSVNKVTVVCTSASPATTQVWTQQTDGTWASS